ncbi:MAG: NADP-dependent isocitrate dehydrogenase [Planctomycetota bacterium]|nr:NADP-dependent isocitrate dehydrogenase [Planctomycetota bacterium]
MPNLFKTPSGKVLCTLIPGDGVGPECVAATQKIIEAAGVTLEFEVRHAGESVFKQGIPSGVPQETIESIKKTRLVLKGPLGTPIGYGEKSANVTLRKLFETYANIRPVRELPGVKTPYSGRGIDLVVVRENVEDLYAGIEHMQTAGVAQCLKLISAKGCEKIVRTAFEFARSEGRKSVACATKSNIMKMTEGMLKRTFERIAPEYPDIQAWHVIIDNCAHQLVKKPEQFDVIVTTNMNGDIISDLTSALIGGLGFAPSANLGNDVAIFEAVHGSAPKYAGKNCINPTAVLMSGVAMLRYIGEFEAANKIEHAVLVTLEQCAAKGVGTGDVVGYDKPNTLSTSAYTDLIISNLGKRSEKFRVREAKPIKLPSISSEPAFVKAKTNRVVGADIFIEANIQPGELGPKVEALLEGTALKLKMISNRGTKVYPLGGAITDCTDQFRCRCVLRQGGAKGETGNLSDSDLLAAIAKVGATPGLKWAHIEKLQEFDGEAGFTKAQGED